MKRLFSLRIATAGIIIILSLIIIFHLLVLSSIIPSDIVWGGNIPDKSQLWWMETIAIAINLLMLLFVCAYAGIVNFKINTTVVKAVFWIMFSIFILNTLGNLLSDNTLEKYIFTPTTLLLALCCIRIATAD